jgi:Ca2+-transporting ATPase
MPLPILAAQIIWLNLVTDGFLDVALAMEPKERGLLGGKFKKPSKYIVDSLMLSRMIIMASVMMAGALYLFQKYLPVEILANAGYEGDMAKAWTISLTALAAFQWLNAWNCRNEDKSIFRQNIFSNKFLIGATFIVVALQFFAVYAPVMQKILRTAPLAFYDWLLIAVVSSSIVLVEETRKLIYRRFQKI